MSVEENLLLGAFSRPGGEQQMLAIARGLMSQPRLLLMDEPSLGLAPQLVSMTFEVVENLRAGGTTILMVEQMARLALRVSERACVLEHGRIVHQGRAADLLEDPRALGAYLGSKRRGARPSPAPGSAPA